MLFSNNIAPLQFGIAEHTELAILIDEPPVVQRVPIIRIADGVVDQTMEH